MIDSARHDSDELIVAERLLYVMECALIHRLDRRLQRRLSRHQDYRNVRVLLPDCGEDVETSNRRHPDIAENNVRLQRGDLLETLPAAKCNVRREPLVLEENTQRIDYSRLVIDYEDGRSRLRAFAHFGSGSPVFW